MNIKIEMEIKRDGNMGVGVGECSPMEPWLMKHVEAIAKEYSERVLSGKSKWPEEIETVIVDLDDEDDDVDEDVPCDECGACYPENELTDGLCEDCLYEKEAEAERERELADAENELAEAEDALNSAEERVSRAREALGR